MRYLLLLLLLTSWGFAAKVNEKLFSENNASKEIQRIRLEIADNVSIDPEIQNKISIQKLFLSKIETLATSSPKKEILSYKTSDKTTLTQKEFLEYFDSVALNLNKLSKYKYNVAVIHERLSSIKEHLKDLAPNEKGLILQAQLEYAYYKWKNIYNERNIKRYTKYLNMEKLPFIEAFKKTKIDIKALEKASIKQNKILQKLYQNKVYLELQLEKETILLVSKKKDEELNGDINGTKLLTQLDDKEKNWKYKFVSEELSKVNKEISKQIKKKNNILVLSQIKNLQDQDLENYIIVRGIMENFSNDLLPKDKAMFLLEQKMLEWIKYEYIGDFTAIWYDFNAWVSKGSEKFLKVIDTPLFYKNDQPVVLYDFLKMFLTIFLGFMLAKFYKHRVNAAQKRIGFIQKQSFKVVGNIGYYLIVIATFAISLSNIGLDLSSLSLVAGALSVGIGFGLQEVVGNFVSGIILMVERSVKIGDFVSIGNEVEGNIIDIRMRSVTVKTSANIDVVVPNSSLVQESFTNYTLEEPIRRLSIPFTVAYGISYEEVNEAIIGALKKSDLNYLRNNAEFENEVIMTGMDERGVNYTLFVFVKTYQTSARSGYFRLIYKTLNDHKFPIPAPRLDVNMNKEN